MDDLRQPINADEHHLIEVRKSTVRALRLGYGLEGVSDACRVAESIVENTNDPNVEPLHPRHTGLHSLKKRVVDALRAGYGIEEIGDAVQEAEIEVAKTDRHATSRTSD